MTKKSTNAQTEHSKRLRAATAKARNNRLIESGYSRFLVMLSPDATADLALIQAQTGESKSSLIERLIRDEAKKY